MSEYAYEHCPLYSAKDKLIKGFTVNDYALEELKYRWDFLRRNKGYKEDYDKSSNEVDGFRELKWLSEAGFSELDFCKKWRIGVPVPPDKPFDDPSRSGTPPTSAAITGTEDAMASMFETGVPSFKDVRARMSRLA